jgi:PhnB protein
MADPVLPIPPQYAAAMPYLVVPDGAVAIDFYKKAFGAIELYRLAAPNGAVVHAELRIGAGILMLASAAPRMDAYPAAHYGGTPVAIVVYVEDVDGFVARALEAGCTVLRAVADQFYGDRSAALTDPFGLRWMFSTHVEDVSPTEMQARMQQMFEERGVG